MSALFNQTNIAPGTAFVTSGGSNTSNFPNGILIGNRFIDSASINGLSPLVTFYATNVPFLSPTLINAQGIYCWDSGNLSIGATYRENTLAYLTASNGAITGAQTLIDVNFSNIVGVTDSNLVFQMKGLSSLQSGNYIIDANKLLSTVQGYGWA